MAVIPYSSMTDGTVTLRPFQFADAPDLHTAVRESLADLKPWMSWAHDGYMPRDASDFIAIVRAKWEQDQLYGFAITDTENGSFVGGCSLSNIHPFFHFCNLGYWVRTSRRGQGLAGKAARLAARFAIQKLHMIRVEVVVAVGNTASLRVAEKLGAHREGVLRNRVVVGSRFHDAVMYSLVPADFRLNVDL